MPYCFSRIKPNFEITMKKVTFIFLILFTVSYYGQNYKLLPDTCTYCFFTHDPYVGVAYNSFYQIGYSVDTAINGNDYSVLSNNDYEDLVYIRQSGNKVFGIIADSVMTEELIMDFDVEVGDTLNNILSINVNNFTNIKTNSFKINAYVNDIDSVLLSDGSYHSFLELVGYEIRYNGIWGIAHWSFRWDEKGLCIGSDIGLGGLMNTLPLSANGLFGGDWFTDLQFCTSDPFVPSQPINNLHSCNYCSPIVATVPYLEGEIQISVSPNPVSERLFIQTSSQESNLNFTIYSLEGRLVRKGNTNSSIDVSELISGMYLVQIDNGKENVTIRFVKE